MVSNNPRLITPPKEEEDIYPYRRAWLSIGIEYGVLAVLATVIYFAINFLGITLPESALLPLDLALACVPAILWLAFSYWRERAALEPRRGLMTVFIVSGLVANAIGIPLIEDLVQPETWLSLESAVNRILGYSFAVAIVHEFLKYLVLRYIVWDRYRVRVDAVAYGAAAAIGYATVLNINYVLNNSATPDIVMLRVLSTTGIHIVSSLIVSYGLVQTQISTPTAFFMPITLFFAAIFGGAVIPVQAGLINPPLALTITIPRLYLGLAFAIVSTVGVLVVLLFFFFVAERREQDILRSMEE